MQYCSYRLFTALLRDARFVFYAFLFYVSKIIQICFLCFFVLCEQDYIVEIQNWKCSFVVLGAKTLFVYNMELFGYRLSFKCKNSDLHVNLLVRNRKLHSLLVRNRKVHTSDVIQVQITQKNYVIFLLENRYIQSIVYYLFMGTSIRVLLHSSLSLFVCTLHIL